MTDPALSPASRPAWADLLAHAQRLQRATLPALFDEAPDRFRRLCLSHDGLVVDFSKQLIDSPVRASLMALADQCGVAAAIRALFDGQALNFTEQRAALHMALRDSCAIPASDAARVRDTAIRLRKFAAAIREGRLTGHTGKPLRHIVNLGIGGSDLGPRMAAEALSDCGDQGRLRVLFVANMDPRELAEALADCNAESTLFIISSKSFTTAETLANADAARQWLHAALGAAANLEQHFAAVSNATEAAVTFGVAADRVFALPDWVGGRYSVWSAIGLPLLIAIGEAAFDAFLAGACSIDTHFRDAPPESNVPLWMGLIGLWNTDLLGIESLAVLPYAHGLRKFPAWLQQLEMESNGKRCLRDGSTSTVHTAPVIWGGVGTIGQHAFHQLFYQGTRRVALDFVVPIGGGDARQRALVQNALAQSAALMSGRDLATARRSLQDKGIAATEVERLAPHLVCPGNQPSTTVLLPRLDPYRLGQLMALYEHKVFVQGWIWGINSFDQYGVELGKEMARTLADDAHASHDPSTAGLLAAARTMRRR